MELHPEDLHGVVVVKDSLGVDSSFVLSHILKLALGDDTFGVLLVSTRYPTSHYISVLRKLSLNISQIAAEQRLRVLNSLRFATLEDGSIDAGAFARAFSSDVRAMQERFHEHTLVIVDDMSILLSLCADSHGKSSMLHFVLSSSFHARLDGSQQGCLVLAGHEDVADDAFWLRSASHCASCVIAMEELDTGKSMEAKAKVSIFRRRGSNANSRLGVTEMAIGGSQL